MWIAEFGINAKRKMDRISRVWEVLRSTAVHSKDHIRTTTSWPLS
jgi:hypothetical protein